MYQPRYRSYYFDARKLLTALYAFSWIASVVTFAALWKCMASFGKELKPYMTLSKDSYEDEMRLNDTVRHIPRVRTYTRSCDAQDTDRTATSTSYTDDDSISRGIFRQPEHIEANESELQPLRHETFEFESHDQSSNVLSVER